MATQNIKLEKIDDIIFISDIHFGAKSASVEWADNITDYFENFFFPLVKMEIVNGYNPAIVVAGDFFDNRQHIDIDIMNRACDVVEKMTNICQVYMLVGNHDIYKKKDTDVTSLRIFERYKDVKVIKDKTVLTIKNGKTFLLIPWVGDFSKESKLIAKNKDKYDYLVLHTEISGMTYDNNRPIVNGINVSSMDDNCRIISGHIHKRQGNSKAMYLGSPYQMSRSDVGNDKGIYCFRLNDDKFEVFFTQNNYSPKFLKIKFSEYGRKAEVWKDVVYNNYVDIVFEEEELNRFNVNKFADELQLYKPRKIEFSCNKKPTVDDTRKYSEDVTIEDIFIDQVNTKGLTDKQNKDIMELNNSYLKRATEEITT